MGGVRLAAFVQEQVVLALTALSASVAPEEAQEARELAERMGADLTASSAREAVRVLKERVPA